MDKFSFSHPSRQSARGIVVLFAINGYKVLKQSIIVIFIFVLNFFRKTEPIGSTTTTIVFYVIVLLLFYLLIIAVLKYVNFTFYIDENHFFLNQGIFKKEQITIAKTSIQNVYIKQNFIQQLINVVALSIETAGDDSTEVEIVAISKNKAIDLKNQLLESRNNLKSTEADKNKSVHFKVSLYRLFLEGISENHIKSVWLVLTTIGCAYNDLKDLFDVLDKESVFQKYFNISIQSEIFNFFILSLISTILLLLIAILYSLLKICIVHFNLAVTKTGNGLSISKGLLNKMVFHLDKEKIQNTTLKTNRLKQFFGLYTIKFTQTMISKKQRKQLAVIGLSKLQAVGLIDKFYPNAIKNLNRQNLEKYFITIKRVKWFIVLFVMSVVMFFVSPYTLVFITPIGLLAVKHVKISYNKPVVHYDLKRKSCSFY